MAQKLKKSKTFFLLLVILISLIIASLGSKFEKPLFKENSIDNPQYANNDIKPVLLEGSSDIGVMLIHGLGATSWETKGLAEYLNARNITTYQVLLAGHGQDVYDLEKTSSLQWYQSVEEAYEKIQKPNKFVIGSSIGSLLIIELSQKRELNGIILISTPITFNDKRVKYVPFLKYFKRYSHREIEEEHTEFYHENFPLKTIAEMVNYINKIKQIIPETKNPILIIQSKNDPMLDPESAQYIYDHIGSENKELMWINSKKHVLIIDYSDEGKEFKAEKTAIFEKTYDFIINNSK